MQKNKFLNTLRKYLAGTAKPAEQSLIEHWYENIEAPPQSSKINENENLQARHWANITNKIDRGRETRGKRVYFPNLKTWAAAASVTIILSAGGYFLLKNEPTTSASQTIGQLITGDIERVTNSASAELLVQLADGTKISLASGSTLSYPKEFSDTIRFVQLEGKAFFDVAHNKAKPFIVNANDVVTRVLGTSFTIQAYKNSDVVVEVKTGRVAVTNSTSETYQNLSQVILTPNQRARINRDDKTITQSLVEKPQLVNIPESLAKARFEEAPVAEIFEALESAYDLKIDFDKEAFSECRITTIITRENLFNKLDAICETLGASYEVDGLVVKIKGNGCSESGLPK